MQFRKCVLVVVTVLCSTLVVMPSAGARNKEPQVKKIVFVPHDNRPISDKQTADVVERLGYEVVVPPDEILGSREDLGHPDELWKWLNEEILADKKEKNEEH